MLHNIAITARQAIALGEWVEDCEQPAAVELANMDGHLLASQGDDLSAWTAAGLTVDDAELDRLHAALHAPVG